MLILGIAPDKSGLIPEDQAQRLREFRQWIDEAFKTNLIQGAVFTANTSARGAGPENLGRRQAGRYWAAESGATKAEIVATLPRAAEFDNIVLEEHIEAGQRVAGFAVDVWDGSNWGTVARGTTIGRNGSSRSIRPGSKIRLVLSDCRDTPALKYFGLHMVEHTPPIDMIADM